MSCRRGSAPQVAAARSQADWAIGAPFFVAHSAILRASGAESVSIAMLATEPRLSGDIPARDKNHFPNKCWFAASLQRAQPARKAGASRDKPASAKRAARFLTVSKPRNRPKG